MELEAGTYTRVSPVTHSEGNASPRHLGEWSEVTTVYDPLPCSSECGLLPVAVTRS